MFPRLYSYVGPPEILHTARLSPSGQVISSPSELTAWIGSHSVDSEGDDSLIATYVVDAHGQLRLAPRRSEHVACAAGGPVLSAGEVTFTPDGKVIEISNHSTGFCPEPESWRMVAAALDRIPVTRPANFTNSVVFRRCPECHERSVVKDDWYVCELCNADLPSEWNFPIDVPSDSPPIFLSRATADKLLRYFSRLYDEQGLDEYALGIECAREWATLIGSDSPPEEKRVTDLLDHLSEDSGGSAWVELQVAVRAWAVIIGIHKRD